MLFSQARKLDVVNTSTATRVGRVEGFVVLPGPPRVALLRLGKVKLSPARRKHCPHIRE